MPSPNLVARLVSGIAAALLLAGPALAQTTTMPMPGSAPAVGNSPASPNPTPSTMMADMERMSQAMRNAPMNGDPDHDFVVMMIPHHQGAMDMAQADRRRLARAILVDQQREIVQMRRWLEVHGRH
jgi:uncharacterized protein (DUF305 family)